VKLFLRNLLVFFALCVSVAGFSTARAAAHSDEGTSASVGGSLVVPLSNKSVIEWTNFDTPRPLVTDYAALPVIPRVPDDSSLSEAAVTGIVADFKPFCIETSHSVSLVQPAMRSGAVFRHNAGGTDAVTRIVGTLASSVVLLLTPDSIFMPNPSTLSPPFSISSPDSNIFIKPSDSGVTIGLQSAIPAAPDSSPVESQELKLLLGESGIPLLYRALLAPAGLEGSTVTAPGTDILPIILGLIGPSNDGFKINVLNAFVTKEPGGAGTSTLDLSSFLAGSIDLTPTSIVNLLSFAVDPSSLDPSSCVLSPDANTVITLSDSGVAITLQSAIAAPDSLVVEPQALKLSVGNVTMSYKSVASVGMGHGTVVAPGTNIIPIILDLIRSIKPSETDLKPFQVSILNPFFP
jgi:hypothetical protein